MIKKILICSFFFISTAIFAMEKETTKFIPPELKSKMMLYIVNAIKEPALAQAIEIIKKQFKAPQLQEVFDKDVFFTERVIELLQKRYTKLEKQKYLTPFTVKADRICIAAKLGTTAANKILKDEYELNPNQFIKVLINLIGTSKSYCAIGLLEFAKNNLKSQDIKELLFEKDPILETSLLMTLIRNDNSRIIELFLELATKHLTPEEKNSLINATDRFGESALSTAYLRKNRYVNIDEAELEKIIALLEKNGAEETDVVKKWKFYK